MKKMIIILIIILPSVSIAFQNEPDGFRGIKWGSDITDLNDMVKVTVKDGDPDTTYYNRSGGTLQLWGTSLHYIQYVFYKGRFSVVRIGFSGQGEFEALKSNLISNYGKATRTSHSYTWTGKMTHISFLHGSLTFFHTPYYRQLINKYLSGE